MIKKDYGHEALDGASRAGFVEVLEWWLQSGFSLRYTEKALESASAKGHVDVLEWWRTNHEKLNGLCKRVAAEGWEGPSFLQHSLAVRSPSNGGRDRAYRTPMKMASPDLLLSMAM